MVLSALLSAGVAGLDDLSPSHTTDSVSPLPTVITGFLSVGSLIQLASGSMKAVEDLTTEDFIQSARVDQELLLDRSTLVKIEPAGQRDLDHVALTFTVGKDKLTVRQSNAIITFPALLSPLHSVAIT